jgi:hypothetical protein
MRHVHSFLNHLLFCVVQLSVIIFVTYATIRLFDCISTDESTTTPLTLIFRLYNCMTKNNPTREDRESS